MRPHEQEYSGQAEGEPDLKRMCQPGESCRNQVGSQRVPVILYFYIHPSCSCSCSLLNDESAPSGLFIVR